MAKHQRRLNGVDEIVLSLTAKGLTTGEISAHFAEIYGEALAWDQAADLPLVGLKAFDAIVGLRSDADRGAEEAPIA